MKKLFTLPALLSLGTTLTLSPHAADACGCLAPPDPSVPIVQAGERILFAQQDGEVTAHIQIQYAGKPGEFGWLLPLPAIPKNKAGKDGIDVGADELFTQLTTATQPKYRLNRVYPDCGGGGGATRGNSPVAFESDSGGGGASPAPQDPKSPVILQDSVGPYDYVVLDASNKDDMFDWLSMRPGSRFEKRAGRPFAVPPGTEDVSKPYIRPGAYFLALRLAAGATAGDVQPVVVRYKSDLPMIPIVLTSVAANPNMGIQVWMLGDGRAIPRNYHHTLINDSQINWFTAGQNYNDVIIKAVGEAPGKHSFVTEYAGDSTVAQNLLDRPGRFALLDSLAQQQDPVQFVNTALSAGLALNSQLTGVLARHIPEPQQLVQQGVSLIQYYQNINGYLSNPGRYPDIADALRNFDPKKALDELRARIVEPTQDAAQLLRSRPYLTRLYTTLSPQDMNKDPVFSFNASLAKVPNLHEATLTYHCALVGSGRYSSATLVTPSGWTMNYSVDEANNGSFTPQSLPYSMRIETLREVGAAEVVVDNEGLIRNQLGGGGCSAATGASRSSAAGGLAMLLSGAALLLVRRRRQAVRSS